MMCLYKVTVHGQGNGEEKILYVVSKDTTSLLIFLDKLGISLIRIYVELVAHDVYVDNSTKEST